MKFCVPHSPLPPSIASMCHLICISPIRTTLIKRFKTTLRKCAFDSLGWAALVRGPLIALFTFTRVFFEIDIIPHNIPLYFAHSLKLRCSTTFKFFVKKLFFHGVASECAYQLCSISCRLFIHLHFDSLAIKVKNCVPSPFSPSI